MVENENLKDVLLEQYGQCWEDKRNYDRMIWQTPAISLAIVAVIVAGLAGTRMPRSPALTLVAIAFALSIAVVGTIQLAKHRFFSIASTAYLVMIQNLIRGDRGGLLNEEQRNIVPDIRFRTDDLRESGIHLPRGWPYTQIAYDWLLWLMYAVIFGLVLWIIASVYQIQFFESQRVTDMILGLFWFMIGALFTIALDKWRYKKARPTAKRVLESRLYHFARILLIARSLLEKSEKEIKKTLFDFDEKHLVFVFDQTERLIDVYGHTMPIDVQDDLMRLGEKAGYLADAIFHLKANFEIIEKLDEWQELRSNVTNLISGFDALVVKLTKHGLLSREFSDHWSKMKALPTRTNSKPPIS